MDMSSHLPTGHAIPKKLTSTIIKQLPAPPKGQSFYWDTEVKGFGVRVTSKAKAFILDRKLQGRTIRLTIGRVGDWTEEQARREAKRLVVEIDKGIDPRLEKKKQESNGVTLRLAFEQFVKSRTLKPRTAYDYARYMTSASSSGKPDFFIEWLDKPIIQISPDVIRAKYKTLCSSVRGTEQASSAMRVLRSVINFAISEYDLPIENPVSVLTKRHLWTKSNKRRTHLYLPEIRPFVHALRSLSNPVLGAYLEFILFTGARRSEAAKLKWENVNSRAHVLTFTDTKNGTDREIPISPRVHVLLVKMKELARGEYVFSTTNKDGKPTHITEPRKSLARANAAAKTSVTVHDLRRTFATLLEQQDCPMVPLKALLGHSQNQDVTTGHYVVIGIERLRHWMDKYDHYMQRLIDTDIDDNVLPFRSGD